MKSGPSGAGRMRRQGRQKLLDRRRGEMRVLEGVLEVLEWMGLLQRLAWRELEV